VAIIVRGRIGRGTGGIGVQLLVGILAVLIGLAFAFGGWRFFLLLLPLWGFVVGFSLGTEAMRALFGDGTFATVTSWVVGFVIAVLFAVFSYLYYYIAIAVLAGTVGYALGASVWGLIGNEQGVIAFVIGLVVGVIFAAVALALNVPRYLVIVLTGLGGAAAVVAGWFILIGKVPSDNVTWWQVGQLIKDSWVYLIVWALIGAAGILAQLRGPAMGPDTYQLEQTSYRYG